LLWQPIIKEALWGCQSIDYYPGMSGSDFLSPGCHEYPHAELWDNELGVDKIALSQGALSGQICALTIARPTHEDVDSSAGGLWPNMQRNVALRERCSCRQSTSSPK
jgi:hypothetical protein